MRNVPITLIVIIILFGCNHPESKKYKRNQGGSKKPYDNGQAEKTNNAYDEELNTFKNTADKNILKMEIENGVRFVWIEINGIKLKFIFDTGASSICISPAEATVLYRQGTLKEEDVMNVEYFQDATGRISEGTTINLREVKIGEKILKNVEALIVDNVNAPLLLGQTVLERFGNIQIDNVRNEIIFE